MSQNQTQYVNQARAHVRRVWYTGSDALSNGVALCYARDYGVATVVEPRRDKNVARPAVGNNTAFAGVATRAYPANTGGQFIEVFEPGSICRVLINISGAIGGFVTAQTTSGEFGTAGFGGRGSAKLLQTVDGSGTAALCLVELLDGEESGLSRFFSLTKLAAL